VTTQLIGPIAYVGAHDLAEATDEAGRVDLVAVNLTSGQDAAEAAVALEQVLLDAGVPLAGVETNAGIRARTEGLFDLLVWSLLIVAGLLGVVAVVGVTGVMTLAVLERTREIGVLRTVGATGGVIHRVLLTEGLTLGILGWILGALFAIPTAWLLGQVLGRAFLFAPLPFRYSWSAVGIWLVATLLIGALGALRPARAASRLTIRETLAYE
jgi:putative ABC transport system permease protein